MLNNGKYYLLTLFVEISRTADATSKFIIMLTNTINSIIMYSQVKNHAFGYSIVFGLTSVILFIFFVKLVK